MQKDLIHRRNGKPEKCHSRPNAFLSEVSFDRMQRGKSLPRLHRTASIRNERSTKWTKSFALRFVLREFLTCRNYGRGVDERKTFRAMVCKVETRAASGVAVRKVKTFTRSSSELLEASSVFPLCPASICNFITRDDLRSRSPEKNLSSSLLRFPD